MGRLSEVKILLGISDDIQDDLLGVIEKLTVSHFKSYTGADNVPDEFDWMIVEVCTKRFNRIGHEGITSQRMDGVWHDFSQSDFNEYDHVLRKRYAERLGSGVKFL